MIIVKGRELLIPENERYIGTTYDDNSTIRTFRIPRFHEDGMDKSQLDFYVIINYDDGSDPDAVGVTKSVSDDYIVLEWDVGEDVTEHPGCLFLWVRGFDYTGAVRWSSFPGVFYIEGSGTEPSDLSDLEQRISEEDKLIRLAKLYKSQPMTAATAAEMKYRDRIYVYVGDETGYAYGDWYFWNEDENKWVSGGAYNAVLHPYTVADYGILPYPAMTDCSDALQELLDQGIDLVFPPGNYWLLKKLTITGGASITGAGSSRTNLIWRPSSESVGIECTLGLRHNGNPNQKDNLFISDITLANASTVHGTAIYVDGRATANDRVNIGPQFRGVGIVGQNANGWDIGIDLNTCNGTSITECSISGDINGTNTAGIRIDSDTDYTIGTEHMIANTKIAYFTHDIEVDRAEGVVVSNSVLLASSYGIYWVSTTGTHPHLAVVNTHINAQNGNVKADHIAQATISNNLFYLGDHGTTENGHVSIELGGTGCTMCTIHGNAVYANTGTYEACGIKYGGNYGTIFGNDIQIGSGATAIVLTNESSYTKVYGNNILTSGTKYSNSGSQNTSDLDSNSTTLVSGPASGVTLVGSNYIRYGVEGVHIHVSFSTTAEIAAETDILQHYVPADLVPMGNYAVFEKTGDGTVVFEIIRTGKLRIKTTVQAGKKFEFDVYARYAT